MIKYNLKDKYVLITGASSGIGKELSRCFAQEGSHCVLAALPDEKKILKEWADELEKSYSIKTFCVLEDLANDKGPEQLYKKVKKMVPRIDVLVNNAGLMSYGSFHEIPLERHDLLLRINARAYMFLMRLFIPGMVEQGDGRILNVSSMSAFYPTAHHAVYGATKVFIQNLSEAVRLELLGTGVKVCILNPGYTETPMLTEGEFPDKLRYFSISGVTSSSFVARKGVNALKWGKLVCIPGMRNKFLYRVVAKFVPRNFLNFSLYRLLTRKE